MNQPKYAVRPNKTQIKREIKELNSLGKELLALPDGVLKKMPLSEIMVEALEDGKRFKKSALQRQLRRIANLMQHEDLEAVRIELMKLQQPSRQQTKQLHQLEQWRDQLIAGDRSILEQLIEQFPQIDRQLIRQLVRNAQIEKKREKPPKSARSLFQHLSQLQASVEADDSVLADQGSLKKFEE